MSAMTFLDRLDGVKSIGAGKWKARCPAHDDRTPSLSVQERDDGIVLLHCFAGCAAESVLGAVGLDFDALYPPREIGTRKPTARLWSPSDLLHFVDRECLIVHVVSADAVAGKTCKPADLERLALARARIAAVINHLPT